MFIDVNSVKINNINFGQYLLEVEYQYPKLWGEDTGRNLKGDFTGTLLGVFPKFKLQFRKLTKSELEYIAPILDSAVQTFTYYDPVKHNTISVSTYTGDWSVVNKKTIYGNRKNEGFEISFIARSKRV